MKTTLEAAPYNLVLEKVFSGNSKLSSWNMFRDEFVSGLRIGANFQGSEDFVYLLLRAKALFDIESKRQATPPPFDRFVTRAINEVQMRDFEFWNPWSNPTLV